VKITRFAIVLILLTGCAARQSGDESKAARETTDPRAALYRAKCISCHALIPPTDNNDDEWVEILEAHRKRLHLEEGDRTRLIEYLTDNN
jgi:hypothetical protein